MYLLILRAIETRRCQVSVNEAQASNGLFVLPDEEDRLRSSRSPRDPMQVRFVSPDRSFLTLVTHRTDQLHYDALCLAAHRFVTFPCRLFLLPRSVV